MLVLGWHGGWLSTRERTAPFQRQRAGVIGHDASAALVGDGGVVAAIEEERLDRLKHSNFFPRRAIRFCLDQAGAKLGDLDAIVVDSSEEFFDDWALQNASMGSAAQRVGARAWLTGVFEREFGVDVSSKLRFCRHHVAHVHGAWYASGFDSGMSACLDAVGDGPSGLIADWRSGEMKVLRHIPVVQSLGYFYLRCIAVLGYRLFDEYKVMGLAPYGNPRVFEPLFSRMYRLLPKGRFALPDAAQLLQLLAEAGLATHPRRKGGDFTKDHKDFAAALQVALERIALHVLTHFRDETGAENLCLSGGVSHNCAMNGTILRSGLFKRVFASPVAHDGGNALGSAIAVLHEEGRLPRRARLQHVYFGRDLGSEDAIRASVQRWRDFVAVQSVAEPAAHAAAEIAQGKVIGWVQGRSEFGPRALGNRSILADPRPAENKRTINAMVKSRESYRPFAPSVLVDRWHEYFEVPPGTENAPFMTLVLHVREHARQLLGAVTHVDGTARVQTVSREQNPRYYELIEHFAQLTSVPIVLNTSFNNNAEPIVDSVDDAIACFLTTGIDRLYVGDWLIDKPQRRSDDDAYLNLTAHLRASYRLVSHAAQDGAPEHAIECHANAIFAEETAAISADVYAVLADTDGGTVAQRCTRLAIDDPLRRQRLTGDLFDLWQRRVLQLMPPSCASA